MATTTEKPTPFTDAMDRLAKDIQADVDGTAGSTPANPTPQPRPADPVPAAPNEIPTPVATTAPGGLILGKFKTEEEATKAHHLLIHSLNASKAREDKLAAELAAARAVPLSPGRADPAAVVARPGPDDEKWRGVYGIDPADIDARIELRVQEKLEAAQAPVRAMQSADAYIVQRYPDFPVKAEDVKVFVNSNDLLRDRVADLWGKGLFAEAMEIGYLAYDNALRTVEIAQATNDKTNAAVGAARGDAAMLTSQAGSPRDNVPSSDPYPRTPEDWARIRAMKAAGKDDEVRRILYGHIVDRIPESDLPRLR